MPGGATGSRAMRRHAGHTLYTTQEAPKSWALLETEKKAGARLRWQGSTSTRVPTIASVRRPPGERELPEDRAHPLGLIVERGPEPEEVVDPPVVDARQHGRAALAEQAADLLEHLFPTRRGRDAQQLLRGLLRHEAADGVAHARPVRRKGPPDPTRDLAAVPAQLVQDAGELVVLLAEHALAARLSSGSGGDLTGDAPCSPPATAGDGVRFLSFLGGAGPVPPRPLR
eukprot:CAMPEP_0176247490 /NCGR_PEP_ID=MMETSP0121_2-20121125/32983_1 /TAXON_ID=160619 /ORGANISM="Kryptoperidinium foliaceum, Strain CCMP 1326" /LENGTH=227 /DNA_ID=CAMNT_0017587149 /DNA_START=107 /DNA_END=787 /DNA_ORIENTATION=-